MGVDIGVPIEVRRLRKSFGAAEVLHGVDFRVERGELVGFLGSNGAGKSTTIRILMGLLSASDGDAFLFGERCRVDRGSNRVQVGYLPGEVTSYPWLSGRTTLQYLAQARGNDCSEEIARLSKLFVLDLAKPVRKYSTGMKQKLGLIQALMHRPRLLILDEPTNGLDPLVRQGLMHELRQRVQNGDTVLFSSHTLNEVDELCDRVIILREGRIIEDQSIVELRKHAVRRVTVRAATAGNIGQHLPREAWLVSHSPGQFSVTWSGSITDLLRWLSGLDCQDILIEQASLDDLFLSYYRGVDEK